MSQFDTAPPNTKAGGNDDALRTKGDDPMVAPTGGLNEEVYIDREAYQRDVPLWRRIWQHSLTQMILLSIQAFCGPAMADAIAGESCIPILHEATSSPSQGSVEVVLRLLRPPTLLQPSTTPCSQPCACSAVHWSTRSVQSGLWSLALAHSRFEGPRIIVTVNLEISGT